MRVVSIGMPVEKMEADLTQNYGDNAAIEFCGGTHLHNAAHCGKMIICSEGSIAKGVRRIMAVTGVEVRR